MYVCLCESNEIWQKWTYLLLLLLSLGYILLHYFIWRLLYTAAIYVCMRFYDECSCKRSSSRAGSRQQRAMKWKTGKQQNSFCSLSLSALLKKRIIPDLLVQKFSFLLITSPAMHAVMLYGRAGFAFQFVSLHYTLARLLNANKHFAK